MHVLEGGGLSTGQRDTQLNEKNTRERKKHPWMSHVVIRELSYGARVHARTRFSVTILTYAYFSSNIRLHDDQYRYFSP